MSEQSPVKESRRGLAIAFAVVGLSLLGIAGLWMQSVYTDEPTGAVVNGTVMSIKGSLVHAWDLHPSTSTFLALLIIGACGYSLWAMVRRLRARA